MSAEKVKELLTQIQDKESDYKDLVVLAVGDDRVDLFGTTDDGLTLAVCVDVLLDVLDNMETEEGEPSSQMH